MDQLIRTIIDAVNARDFEALRSLPLDPEFEFRSLISDSEGATYVGIDGLIAWADDIDEVFDGFRIELTEIHPAGDDRAVIVFRVSGAARSSGAPFAEVNAQVWTWRDGKLSRNIAYSDPEEAKRSAGIG